MQFRQLTRDLALGLSLALLSAGSFAGGITGKNNLICAAVNVVGCIDGNCTRGPAETFDMPNFMYVDAQRKLVHADNEKGEEVSSPIRNYDITESAILLQGIEKHRGWTINIDRGDGGMIMSSIGSDVNFIVTGNCTER